jgi:type IV fimbrial biogenesis protein FimT
LRSRQAGFTLSELLVSLTVGALLLGVGIPSYMQFSQDAQQISSANDLISSLHAARDVAVTLCPTKTGADCDAGSWAAGWLAFIDEDGSGSVGADEDILLAAEDLDDLTVNSTEFSQFLIYRPNGRIMVESIRQNMGEFTLCDQRGAEHARVVIIDMSGRPQVSEKAADGSAPTCPADA